MNINQRIEELMNDKRLNYRSLGLKIGYSDTQVRNIIKGKSSPKVDFIQSLSRIYPNISLDWLVNGEGVKDKNQKNLDIHSMSIDDILQLDLDKNISKLVRFLIENNSLLLEDLIYREFIKDNIQALDLITQKEETQKKISKVHELMKERLLSKKNTEK